MLESNPLKSKLLVGGLGVAAGAAAGGASGPGPAGQGREGSANPPVQELSIIYIYIYIYMYYHTITPISTYSMLANIGRQGRVGRAGQQGGGGRAAPVDGWLATEAPGQVIAVLNARGMLAAAGPDFYFVDPFVCLFVCLFAVYVFYVLFLFGGRARLIPREKKRPKAPSARRRYTVHSPGPSPWGCDPPSFEDPEKDYQSYGKPNCGQTRPNRAKRAGG